MCGIFGVLGSLGSADSARHLIGKMGATLTHRGPDSGGVWLDVNSGIALGHRRLAILDLSEKGAQPMVSGSGRYVLTFNGEIYNFADLRSDIEKVAPDIRWRGTSDTEILAAAIDLWGIERAISNSVGMFALAVWDRTKRELHLVRDRMGEKPIYYGWLGSTFAFASELKALRTHPAWQGRIDRSAIATYLRYGYVPTPMSIFSGIRKLKAGSILSLPASVGSGYMPDPVVYWRLSDAVEIGRAQSFSGDAHEAEDELDAILRRSIKGQMISDVPLGAFLSGGVDSSAVVALMQAQSSTPIRTFTIGFSESAYDEAGHARQVASHLGTCHEEFYVTGSNAFDVIPKLPNMYDEPFADSSQIATYLVSKLARTAVTVSLSGDGGDELFGGYNRYLLAERLRTLRRLSPPAVTHLLRLGLKGLGTRTVEPWLDRLTRLLPARLVPLLLADKLQKLATILDAGDDESIYQQLVSQWSSPNDIMIDGREWIGFHETWASAKQLTYKFREEMMYVDTLTYLCDDILVKLDRAAMAVSLESRVPLLDHRLVQFAWSLPPAIAEKGRQNKQLLRKVLDRYVPQDLIERPKMGFAVPIGSWLRGPLREWADDLLSTERLRADGYFVPSRVRERWVEHLSGRRNWQHQLWAVLMFQAWLVSGEGG
ncbi:MAG: asparagine synthase (glutamine-hydrolyzing) [Pseudomonadota bacterium]